MLPVLREYGVEFVEQPLSSEDLEGLAALQRRGILPIVVDESCIVATDIRGSLGSSTESTSSWRSADRCGKRCA